MVSAVRELVQARELLITWTLRDFKVRYSQSLLGAAWAIIQPFSLMVVFSIIFSLFVKVPSDGVPYPLFVYTALLPWTFFANSLSFAIPSLVNNMNLVSKIYFPREIMPLSSILVCFIDFLFAAVIFVAMMLWYRVPLGLNALFIPLTLLIQIVLTFGLSLFGAALNVFFRDVRFLIPLVLQLWMYVSPVIYPISTIPEKYQVIYFLNPMAVIIDTYRRAILFNQAPDWPFLGLAATISLLVLFLSYRFFKRAEKNFADLI